MSKRSGVLKTLKGKLAEMLEDQLAGLYLYGSQARGEATHSSDVDVLIVLHTDFDYSELLARTSHLIAALSLEHDIVISRVFVTKKDFVDGQSPFLRNVRWEAVLIDEWDPQNFDGPF